MKLFIMAFFMLVLFIACDKMPTIDHDTMLDGDKIFDPSLYEPEKYLVSAAIPNPTPADLAKPVVVATHGYSATTFEWDEFREWTGDDDRYLISQVLLGGHGRDYETFKKSSWQDWQSAIKDEYNKLENSGYQNITLLCSSTACPLVLELVDAGYFNGKQPPRNILLVDPIVIPSDKLLSLIGFIGPMLGYIETDPAAGEFSHWYHFRPQETLQQLQKLLHIVRKDLQRGISLPAGTRLKAYKSKKDPTADPVSAVLIYKGVEGVVEIEMVDSELHVFTRLAGRDGVTDKDIQNQSAAFSDIRRLVLVE